MADPVLGYTGSEILQHLQDFTGNTSASFARFLTFALPLAEYRYCKAHDWAFLNKVALPLAVTSGTILYPLTTATTGFNIRPGNVREIYTNSGRMVMRKTTVDFLRRLDPSLRDGSATTFVNYWAPVDDTRIMIYPHLFSDTQVLIDAKVTANALLNLSNYPTIPFDFQESFIEYCKWVALARENDDRAEKHLRISQGYIKQDIQEDLAMLGDTDIARVKSLEEQQTDGVSSDLQQLYNIWAFYSY